MHRKNSFQVKDKLKHRVDFKNTKNNQKVQSNWMNSILRTYYVQKSTTKTKVKL